MRNLIHSIAAMASWLALVSSRRLIVSSFTLSLVVLPAIAGLSSSQARAAFITYNYKATNIGRVLTGTFGFDTSALDESSSPTFGRYSNAGFMTGTIVGGPQNGSSFEFDNFFVGVDNLGDHFYLLPNASPSGAYSNLSVFGDGSMLDSDALSASIDFSSAVGSVNIANVDLGLGAGVLGYNFEEATLVSDPAALFRLDVTYSDGAIISGPLSGGLSALPDNVSASFLVSGAPGATSFGIADVQSADVTFGDGVWDASLLNNFSLEVDPVSGNVSHLTYDFNPINTSTTLDYITLNFPLTVTGTDIATGQAFEYQYTSSTYSLSAVPEPSSIVLLGMGVVVMGFSTGLRRRNRRAARAMS